MQLRNYFAVQINRFQANAKGMLGIPNTRGCWNIGTETVDVLK